MRVGVVPFDEDITNPASRLRGFEVVRGLVAAGVDAEVVPAAPAGKCDVVVFGRYQVGEAPALLDCIRGWQNAGAKVIFDFADDLERGLRQARRDIRGVPWGDRLAAWRHASRCREAIGQILASADWVTVSADRLLPLATRGGRQATVVPDVIAPEFFALRRRHLEHEPVSLVWTGYLDNVVYLEQVEQALERVSAQHRIELSVVTSVGRRTIYRGRWDNREIVAGYHFPTRFAEWRLDRAWSELFRGDIGLAPVPPGIIKSANKAATYMAMGIPVAASDTLEYARIIEHGTNGFLCRTPQDWEAALSALVASANLRGEMGERAWAAVEQYCSMRAVALRWQQVFAQL